MKKFCLKLLIGGAIPCILILLANTLFVRTNYFRTLNGVQKFQNVPYNITIANFGNSHSMNGFDWKEYPEYTTANMALASQSFLFDEAILNQFMEHFDEHAVIIIDISHRSLYEENPLLEINSRVTRYYQVLDRNNMPDWTLKNAIVYRYCPILSEKTNAIKYILNDKPDATPQIESALDIKNPVKAGKDRANVFLKHIGSQELSLQYDALCRMLETADAHNIRVLLVTVPTTTYFYESFSPEFYEKFYTDIQSITAMYSNTIYIDYTGDERFLSLDLYRNTDHLNPQGARLFTSAVVQDLIKLGWIF